MHKCKFSYICKNECIQERCCYYLSRRHEINCEECVNFLICHSDQFDLSSIDEDLEKIIESSKKVDFNQQKINIPGYIPRVELSSIKRRVYDISVIKENNIDTILVTSKRMLSRRNQSFSVKPSFNQDLHKLLDFKHKIILSQDIPDLLCIKQFQYPELILNAINTWKPDLITGFDADFYLTNPIFITKLRLLQTYNLNYLLSKIKIPIIPFYNPIDNLFFDYQKRYFDNTNSTYLVVPGYFYKIQNSLLKKLNLKNQKKRQEIELVNTNHKLIFLNCSPKCNRNAYSYSSHTWRCFSNSKKQIKIKESDKLSQYIKTAQSNRIKNNQKLDVYMNGEWNSIERDQSN